ncbi:hypothetical protein CR513_17365, partial [Mucuna pruriens]
MARRLSSTLIGFAGEQVEIYGCVEIKMTFGMGLDAKTLSSVILKWLVLNKFCGIVLSPYLCMKYLVGGSETPIGERFEGISNWYKPSGENKDLSITRGRGRKVLGEEKRKVAKEETAMVEKSSCKWRMHTNYTDLNKACPKNPYLLLSIERLIDGALGYNCLSFMDAYSGYIQI